MALPLPRKIVLVPSKSSTVCNARLDTVTVTEAVTLPAVAVMVPVPGVVAVKLPC